MAGWRVRGPVRVPYLCRGRCQPPPVCLLGRSSGQGWAASTDAGVKVSAYGTSDLDAGEVDAIVAGAEEDAADSGQVIGGSCGWRA